MTELIYKGVLEKAGSDREGWYRMDISHLFRRYGSAFSRTRENNFLVTTSALRDVHYAKQKNNAFYHIQAMDLPFQNIEFHYLDLAHWEEYEDMFGKTENDE